MSDAHARPGLFNIRKRYTRIECEEPDYEGLWAEVRTNLTHDERGIFVEELAQLSVDGKDHFTRMLNAFTDAQQAQMDAERAVLTATAIEDEAERDAAKEAAHAARTAANDAVWNAQQELITANSPEIVANRAKHWELVAPFIRAWNVCDDDENEVPPPMQSGLTALPHIDQVISTWLTATIEKGYRLGKGVRSLSKKPDDSPEQKSGPQIVSAAEPSS